MVFFLIVHSCVYAKDCFHLFYQMTLNECYIISKTCRLKNDTIFKCLSKFNLFHLFWVQVNLSDGITLQSPPPEKTAEKIVLNSNKIKKILN